MCLADSVCRSHEDRGIALSARSAYREALAAFQAAYARAPEPTLLINMGRCLFHLGRMQEALDHYNRFERANASPDPKVAQKLQQYMKEAQAALAIAPEKSGAPEASGDNAAARETSPATPLWPPLAEAPVDALITSGAEAVVTVPAPPSAATTATAPTARRSLRAASASLLSLGTVSLALGISLGVRAQGIAQEVVGAKNFDSNLYTQGIALDRAAITLDVLGGAAAMAGAVCLSVWLARQPKRNEGRKVGVRHPWPSHAS